MVIGVDQSLHLLPSKNFSVLYSNVCESSAPWALVEPGRLTPFKRNTGISSVFA